MEDEDTQSFWWETERDFCQPKRSCQVTITILIFPLCEGKLCGKWKSKLQKFPRFSIWNSKWRKLKGAYFGAKALPLCRVKTFRRSLLNAGGNSFLFISYCSLLEWIFSLYKLNLTSSGLRNVDFITVRDLTEQSTALMRKIEAINSKFANED